MSEREVGNPIGKALVGLAIAGGGWYFLKHYEIQGLESVQVVSRGAIIEEGDEDALVARRLDSLGGPRPGIASQRALIAGQQGIPSTLASTRLLDAGEDTLPEADDADSVDVQQMASEIGPIRVGSWALAGFDRHKLAKPHVMRWFCGVVRQMDVIALQQITGRQRDLLPRIVEQLNRTGRKYDFLLGPAVGPQVASPGSDATVLSEQYAFLFDTERLETDRGQMYTVADPNGAISYDPLVGWFRVRGVPVERAWTFTVVNFRVDAERAVMEIPLVSEIMAAVASDGRGEDDLLLAGMLAADDRELVKHLGGEACRAAVQNTPTDIFERYQLSNILSPRKTTTESLEHGGVLNFANIYQLNQPTAEELSPHLPVFAEFTPTEGN